MSPLFHPGTEVQVELRITVVGMIRLGLSRGQLQRPGAVGDPEPVLLQIHQGHIDLILAFLLAGPLQSDSSLKGLSLTT